MNLVILVVLAFAIWLLLKGFRFLYNDDFGIATENLETTEAWERDKFPSVPGLTPEEVQQTIDEAEREVGLQVAELVKVPDGWYTEKVELVVPQYLSAMYYGSADPFTADVCPTKVSKLAKPEPRYKEVVRWKKV